MSDRRPAVGDRLELEVGPVAHGGHCVARYGETGLVVFVRHAIPGERVVAVVTGDDTRFLRADAVEVLEASPDRVEPPCPYAGPGRCGGCDLQHVAAPHQRRLKAEVVREQLQRLAGLDLEVVVEEVEPTLRWRSRTRYVVTPDGGRGFRQHRSHDVVTVDDCLIEAEDSVREHEDGDVVTTVAPGEKLDGAGRVVEQVATSSGTHAFAVDPGGFWQSHVEAPRLLVETVVALAEPRAGERVLDLYAGVGLFSAFLADAVGPAGRVTAVEGDRTAAELSLENLADLPVSVRPGRVDRVLHRGVGPAEVVVLDPPRVGAKRQVVRQVAALQPRVVVYVACDPAALARDAAYLAEQGYRLDTLRALDLFPMTHHVECVARFVPVTPAAAPGAGAPST